MWLPGKCVLSNLIRVSLLCLLQILEIAAAWLAPSPLVQSCTNAHPTSTSGLSWADVTARWWRTIVDALTRRVTAVTERANQAILAVQTSYQCYVASLRALAICRWRCRSSARAKEAALHTAGHAVTYLVVILTSCQILIHTWVRPLYKKTSHANSARTLYIQYYLSVAITSNMRVTQAICRTPETEPASSRERWYHDRHDIGLYHLKHGCV